MTPKKKQPMRLRLIAFRVSGEFGEALEKAVEKAEDGTLSHFIRKAVIARAKEFGITLPK